MKRQRLTLYDTSEVMVSFEMMNQQSELALQKFMKSKMEAEKQLQRGFII
jgi:hypothetical protein